MRELSLYCLFVGCENVRVVLEVTRFETHRSRTPNKSMETKYFMYLFHDAWPAYTNPKDSTSSVSRKLVFSRDCVHVFQFEASGCETAILLRRSGPNTSLRLWRGPTNIRYAAVIRLESCNLYGREMRGNNSYMKIGCLGGFVVNTLTSNTRQVCDVTAF